MKQLRHRASSSFVVLIPSILLVLIVMVVPLCVMVLQSFRGTGDNGVVEFSLSNYVEVLSEAVYLKALLATIEIALATTLICIVLAFPAALLVSRLRGTAARILTILVMAPLMLGVVVRVYGWFIVLGREGLVNHLLAAIDPSLGPVQMLYTRGAVVLGLVQILIPFAFTPILNSVRAIDPLVGEAAMTLGAPPRYILWRVIIPLSRPGVLAAGLIVFPLAVTSYAIPTLLGGGQTVVMSMLAYDNLLVVLDYSLGSAIGIVLSVVTMISIVLYFKVIDVNKYSS